MNTEQPLALKLADEVDEVAQTFPDMKEVSDELRRLHAENEQLRQKLAGRGELVAWITKDGERAVTQKTKAGRLKDGGASASSVKPFCVPAFSVPPDTDALLDQALDALEQAYFVDVAKGIDAIAAIRKHRGRA
jgi:hypothetical protein